MSATDFISKYSGVEMDSGITGGLSVGNLSALPTTEKSSVVAAMTELFQNNFSNIGLPEFDIDNYIITFKTNDGQIKTVDLPLEGLSADLSYDVSSKSLVITKKDGTKITIGVSDLIDVYVGSTGANIQIRVTTGNVMEAILLDGTIDKAKLTLILQGEISSAVEHIGLNNNPHNTTADQIGLGNVNNTRDSDKPVSTAQALAIANAISSSRLFVKRISFTTAKTITTTEQTLAELNYTVTEAGDYLMKFIANLISSDVTFLLLTSMSDAFVGLSVRFKKNGSTIALFNGAIPRANKQSTLTFERALTFAVNDVISVTVTASLPGNADLSIPNNTSTAVSFSKIKIIP